MTRPGGPGSHYGPGGMFHAPAAPRGPAPGAPRRDAEQLPAPDAAALARAVDGARAALDAEQRRPARAAPDPGEVLASLPRVDGTELRVSVHVYEGHPFVRVAPWQRGDGGAWWPVKGKGASVRPRELAHVVVALARALEQLQRAA